MSNVKKKIEVVMIPTEKASNNTILLCPAIKHNGKEWLKLNKDNSGYQPKILKPQHLYFLSNELIKEGDWYCFPVHKGGYAIKQYNEEKHFNEEPAITLANLRAKKVIATTDESIACVKDILSINQGRFTNHYPTEKWILPSPSPQFIDKFIEEYNKGNVIKEVMVEYESYHGINTSIAEINNISGDGSIYWRGENKDYKLKVDKNNHITITRCKDSWSRDEVIQLLNKREVEYMMSHTRQLETLNEFINQNL